MDDRGSTTRVGALVLLALAVGSAAVILVGEQSRLFSPKNDYTIEFVSVSGLKPGSPVELNGVEVGTVDKVVLPQSIDRQKLIVHVAIEKVYSDRIRTDSRARIRSLGLLGDKYVEVTGGSADQARIEPGGQIPTAPQTNVDKLISSGEDLVDKVQSIAHSLDVILRRVERGEGLIGELTSNQEAGKQVTGSLVATMEAVQRVAEKAEHGDGLLGRLVSDAELADRFVHTVDELDGTLSAMRTGPGLAPRLLSDPELAQRFGNTLTSLETSAAAFERTVANLDQSEALLPKLLTDEEYGRRLASELEQLVTRLNTVAAKLAEGDGTAARLLDDPSVYEAIQDVVVGVEESKLLRWLIRNRQKKGIEERYEAEHDEASDAADEPPASSNQGQDPGSPGSRQ